jgi:hypothetical protein
VARRQPVPAGQNPVAVAKPSALEATARAATIVGTNLWLIGAADAYEVANMTAQQPWDLFG